MGKVSSLFEVIPGDVLVFGVTKVASGVQFAVYIPDKKECTLKLYRIGRKEPSAVIPLKDEYKRGSAYFLTLTKIRHKEDGRDIADVLSDEYEYMYEADGEEYVDPFAQIIHGRSKWGKPVENGKKRSGICLKAFEWGDDRQLRIPFDDLILYQLHVRGYTKHASSGVQYKGTFKGLESKITYIKELGVNGVMLLPCYDFNEIQEQKQIYLSVPQKEDEIKEEAKLNYWGYGTPDTFYFAPKSSYSSETVHADIEMKEMVRAFHKAGIEVLMDIYFSPGTNLCLMTECLRNWVLNYHIDGFRVNQEIMPSLTMVSDPILSGVKLLTSYWDKDMLMHAGVLRTENALAEYNEGFMNDARRFLKSDEGMVQSFVDRFKRNPDDYAVINFITHVNGFTLMDLVSYDIKHNESNGELNRDGTEYNYSWNCGVEGKTRKKVITKRRMIQIRNAFLMLLCSQGTPMILAGDEFGNTQLGNNNPYCHDNPTTWINWKHGKVDLEILEYVKKLIRFRREHRILHMQNEFTMMDTKGYGMPDMSIHGVEAWRADYSYYNRMLGVLLCGKYAKNEDDYIYIAFNMYWEEREFELPNLPAGMKWYTAVDTFENKFGDIPEKKNKSGKVTKSEDISRQTTIMPRSIVVFVGR